MIILTTKRVSVLTKMRNEMVLNLYDNNNNYMKRPYHNDNNNRKVK